MTNTQGRMQVTNPPLNQSHECQPLRADCPVCTPDRYIAVLKGANLLTPAQVDGQLSVYVAANWSTSLLQHFTGYRAVAKHRVTRKWENRNLRLMRKQGTAAHGGASRDSARTSILSANYMRTQLLQLGGSIRGKNI